MKLFQYIVLCTTALSLYAGNATAQKRKKGFTREQHKEALQRHYKEIVAMADNKHCNNPNEFTFAPFGSKACGGPQTYIIYSKNIDTKKFLEKLAQYNMAEASYNQRWDITSDCMMAPVPSGIKCEDNKPVGVYEQ